MEEDDKGCPMIKMGVSGWMFLLVPAYPGSPGQKAVKQLCVCVCVPYRPHRGISTAPVHNTSLLSQHSTACLTNRPHRSTRFAATNSQSPASVRKGLVVPIDTNLTFHAFVPAIFTGAVTVPAPEPVRFLPAWLTDGVQDLHVPLWTRIR